MAYQIINAENYIIGPSSGTTAISEIRLGNENTFIAVESVAMLSGEVYLRDAPSRRQLREAPQTNVPASLERSIRENAAVWRELSKY